MSAGWPAHDGRVKASAGALPLARLAALTRPPRADARLPSARRRGMGMMGMPLLPRAAIADDGVEDGEQLAGGRDKRNELGLAGLDEPVAEGPELGVVAGGDQGADEKSGTHRGAATANEALAFPLARLPGPRRQPDQGGGLTAVDAAELGQLGEQGSGNGPADAGNRGQQLLLLAPGRGAAHGLVDVDLEAGKLLLQRGAQAGDALLQARLAQAFLPLPRGHHHLDDLPAAGDEIGEQPRLLVGQRPNLRL